MTLKELQNMIKEEFDAYMGEQEDDVDVSVSDNDVDAEMGDEMGDEMAPEGEEDVLRKIYDLLAAHFGGEEGEEDMDDMDEMGDVEDVEGDEEADIEENSTTKAKFQKQGYAAGGDTKGGTNSGFGNVGGKGNDGYPTKAKTNPLPGEGSVTALQERFQKLANIIK